MLFQTVWYFYLKEVEDPERFGVPKLSDGGNVVGILEKPKNPLSKFAVTGLYIYPSDVFDFIKTLKPSQRGELEITDVNNWYIKQGRLKIVFLDGFWSDAGIFKSLLKATLFVSKTNEEAATFLLLWFHVQLDHNCHSCVYKF